MTVKPIAGTVQDTTGFSYSAGRATEDFAFPPRTVNAAISGAMDDLRIHSIKPTKDGTAWMYQAVTEDDRRVLVILRPNRGTSRLSVRIGWFGDEPLSKALMERVGVRLGSLPPSAAPVDRPERQRRTRSSRCRGPLTRRRSASRRSPPTRRFRLFDRNRPGPVRNANGSA